MEELFTAITDFIMTSSQEALCFILQTAAALTGIALCIRCFRHWKLCIPLVGICLLTILTAPLITQHFLVPFAAGLVRAVLWFCVFFLFLATPILLIIRWVATFIISHFQQLQHRCEGCIHNQSGNCSHPSTCQNR